MQTPRPRTKVRYLTWYALFYLPRRMAAAAVTRRADVYGICQRGPSLLAQELRAVNTYRPTPMCQEMTAQGSDNCRLWHNYTTIYAKLLDGWRGRALTIAELGLGTNNPALVSSMGSTGRPGASLRGWRALFPKARIFGADIDRDILFEEERIKTFYCDQLDPAAIAALWAQPELADGADLIIEDGLHTFEANIAFMNGSLGALRPHGIYVIEDIATETLPQWRAVLAGTYAPKFPAHDFALLALPNPANRLDNNMLVVRRLD